MTIQLETVFPHPIQPSRWDRCWRSPKAAVRQPSGNFGSEWKADSSMQSDREQRSDFPEDAAFLEHATNERQPNLLAPCASTAAA